MSSETNERDAVRTTVEQILGEVRAQGEPAIRRWSQRFDGWSPPSFRLTGEQARELAARAPADVRAALDVAAANVRRFAEAQRAALRDVDVEVAPGLHAGHRLVPVGAVGAYVPGGRYRLVSSALMSVLTAKVAGVPRVVAVFPPAGAEGPSPATVHAALLAGADELVVLGGVQAIGALAYGGLPDVAPVDMVVGAGNAYVTEAKRQVFGQVGIDLLAGPTEILVIADETATPALVAIDLLSQAEHGPTSPAVLVSTSAALAEAVVAEVERRLPEFPDDGTAATAWREHGEVVVVATPEQAVAAADARAPEHLEVHTADPGWYHARLRNYGALFLGEQTTVTFGDKAAGPNHTLPTGLAARYTGGLWAGSFLKVLTYQRATAAGAAALAPVAAGISRAEGLLGHAAAAEARAAFR
ncbi:histidinol dehydrogenase [Conexibacter sp. JD483]|uniref:histidinol dehydrogenase n=1 Tax=unclassified Conexibacter TaxID=2627773 RepID=UPI00271EE302|nr:MULTISPECIES: histidinol dehydrogenase [unclassified Conexibacter]MDO8184758.1 histidinol dehydrogenase [Conexibacter sp. CPCC 205706]MDO8196533.1 histidinol dehydrogenase [Conexibacter sp. CPCC 205762]MDR9369019.1 histidinol dehydrogenase [Conexibacter sp. JD483]